MLRDHQFLVRRHDEEHNPALRPRNERFGLRISRRVENGAEPCKLLRDAGTHHRRVFANSRRENEGLEPAQCGRQHSGIEPYAVNEVVEGELRAGIRARLEIPRY
jgi:hypothetical protein